MAGGSPVSLPLTHAAGPWGLFGVAGVGTAFWIAVLFGLRWRSQRLAGQSPSLRVKRDIDEGLLQRA